MNKAILVALMFAGTVCTAAVGCGDSTSDGNGGSTGTGSQTCDSSHECINDVCTCSTEGKDGTSCTDEDLCETECEVCVSS